MNNFCEGCFEKQGRIDELEEENKLLKARLRYRERKEEEGFFGSSTPSSKIPFKPNGTEEKNNSKGGAQPGHVGYGRRAYDEQSADEVIEIEGDSICPDCGGIMELKEIRTRTVIEAQPTVPKKIV